jgi:2-hydroxy-3-oxopropionate reductase
MVGGEAEDVEHARPVLEAVGKIIVHVGPDGAGQTVKAANQLIVAGNIALVAEAVVLLEAGGVDAASALTVLTGGLAGSRVLEQKGPMMLARAFQPGFRIDLHHKDMGIALSVARESGVPLPVTGVVAQLVAAARAQGLGSLDHAALFPVIEGLAGRGPNGVAE